MAISFDKALGIHLPALHVRARRAELLAGNLANADTPNYQARDIDFRAVLSGVQQFTKLALNTTNESHIQTVNNGNIAAEVLYRHPNQAAIDGNTVDPEIEKVEFSENAVRYQASLQFLGNKFKGLIEAIKAGE